MRKLCIKMYTCINPITTCTVCHREKIIFWNNILQCVVPGNIYINIHPKEEHKNIQGERPSKARYLKGKYTAKLNFPYSQELCLNQTSFNGRSMNIFWNNAIIILYGKLPLIWVKYKINTNNIIMIHLLTTYDWVS